MNEFKPIEDHYLRVVESEFGKTVFPVAHAAHHAFWGSDETAHIIQKYYWWLRVKEFFENDVDEIVGVFPFGFPRERFRTLWNIYAKADLRDYLERFKKQN